MQNPNPNNRSNNPNGVNGPNANGYNGQQRPQNHYPGNQHPNFSRPQQNNFQGPNQPVNQNPQGMPKPNGMPNPQGRPMPQNNFQGRPQNNFQDRRPKKKTGPNWKMIITISAIALILIGLVVKHNNQVAFEKRALEPVNVKNTNYVKMDFKSGSTLSEFAVKLKKKDLIYDSGEFIKYFVNKGEKDVKAGTYYVRQSMSVADYYKLLNAGPNEDIARQQFIAERAPFAQKLAKKYNVLASINLAQSIVESQWGQSKLAYKYNNYYGIKAIGNQKSVTMTTQEYFDGADGGATTIKDKFAVYDSWQDGMEAHAKFLVNGVPKNKDQFKDVLNAKNYIEAAYALVTDGYATDPKYAQNLISIIQEYKLNQYD